MKAEIARSLRISRAILEARLILDDIVETAERFEDAQDGKATSGIFPTTTFVETKSLSQAYYGTDAIPDPDACDCRSCGCCQ